MIFVGVIQIFSNGPRREVEVLQGYFSLFEEATYMCFNVRIYLVSFLNIDRDSIYWICFKLDFPLSNISNGLRYLGYVLNQMITIGGIGLASSERLKKGYFYGATSDNLEVES